MEIIEKFLGVFTMIVLPTVKDMSRAEQTYYNHIINSFNQQLELTNNYIGSKEFWDEYYQKYETIEEFIHNCSLNNNLNDFINNQDYSDADEFIQSFYELGAELGYEDIDRTFAFTNADKQALYHLKQYNYDLIRDCNDELRQGIRNSLFQCMLRGDNPRTIRKEIEGLLDNKIRSRVPLKFRAEMIARTEHARAVNTGTLQAYSNYGVELVDVLTAGDGAVCDICLEAANNNPHPIKEVRGLCPFHPLCRCAYAAHINEDTEIYTNPMDNPNIINLIPINSYDESIDNLVNQSVDYSRLFSNDYDSAKSFLNRLYPTPKNLNLDEINFIREWANDSGPLNRFLRGDKKSVSMKYFNNYLKHLNTGLSKYDNIKTSTILHRRVNGGFFIEDQGKIGTFNTPISTTFNKFGNEEYGDYHITIIAPKGSKGAYIDEIILEGNKSTHLDEWLLPIGTKYKTLKIDKESKEAIIKLMS